MFMTQSAKYIMIGGFLGAGKTTAMGRLAQYLTLRGQRVGLITNDQAGGLVDTRLMRSQGYATEEIAGGCFCCRFNTLVDAAAKLSDEAKPEVFVAEPVGSCTDLVATVTYPLRRMYGDAFSIAPLSVLVDPLRARRVLGLEEGRGFSSKVTYIYRKQLEEADFIVINKADLLQPEELAELRTALAREFPLARVFALSARQGDGLEPWFEALLSESQAQRGTMEVDYEIYAEGEALLGWLNATVTLAAEDEFDANAFLQGLAGTLQGRLAADQAEVAHLKMTYSPDDGIAGEIASVNLVRNENVPETGMSLDEPSTSGQLILNLRAEADPVLLAEMVQGALAEVAGGCAGLAFRLEHEEHFRPGKPVPTHRVVA
jgi:G3E family GTPase